MLQNKDVMCYSVNCTMLAKVRIAHAGKHRADPLWALGRWCVLKAVPAVCDSLCQLPSLLQLRRGVQVSRHRPTLSFCCSDIVKVTCPRSQREPGRGNELGWGIGNNTVTSEPFSEKHSFLSGGRIIKCCTSIRS